MAIKFLGISDEYTTCQQCGKINLKRTVALDFDGDVRHYGSECAAQALNTRKAGVDDFGAAVAFAQKYAGQYDGTELAKGVAARFGYSARARGNTLYVYGANTVAEIELAHAVPMGELERRARAAMIGALLVWDASGAAMGSAEHRAYLLAVARYARQVNGE